MHISNKVFFGGIVGGSEVELTKAAHGWTNKRGLIEGK